MDSEDKGHGEKIDASVGVLDDSERLRGGRLTAISEAELMAGPDAAIAAPSLSRLAQKSVGVSSGTDVLVTAGKKVYGHNPSCAGKIIELV